MRRIALVALMLVGCATDQPESVNASAPDATADANPTQDMTGADAASDTALPDMGPDGSAPDMDEDLGSGDMGAIAVRAVAAECPMSSVEPGTAWTGWANLQFPSVLRLEVGEASEPIFGQTYQEGVTDQPGMAPGWEAQLMVGPLGADPQSSPRCFRALDAEFNVDSGNNDEWQVRIQAERAGLYGMFFRFRPPGGDWRYGDLNGSDDGASVEQAGVLIVDDPAGPDEIRAVTLNLRCRTAEWNVRRTLVLDALEAVDPHVIGLQEDCSVPGEQPQSYEILSELADRLDRGYQTVREVTHLASHPEGDFDEGISLFTALPNELYSSEELPFANFARRLQVLDVGLGDGTNLRVLNTHFDFGGGNDDIRAQEATATLGQVQAGPAILLGDLNTDPGDPAYGVLEAELEDVWVVVGAGDGFTLPADAPTRRIDYIWHSGLTPRSANVVDESSGGIFLSDHLGVTSTLTLD